jgi:hypothetical protein
MYYPIFFFRQETWNTLWMCEDGDNFVDNFLGSIQLWWESLATFFLHGQMFIRMKTKVNTITNCILSFLNILIGLPLHLILCKHKIVSKNLDGIVNFLAVRFNCLSLRARRNTSVKVGWRSTIKMIQMGSCWRLYGMKCYTMINLRVFI